MRSYPWKITTGSRFIDSGTIEANSEGEALNLVLIEQAEDKETETSYRVTVGNSSASSYGDEFLRTAGASSMDDTDLTPSGHAFAPQFHPLDELVKSTEALGKTAEDCKNKFDNLGPILEIDGDRVREFEQLTRTMGMGCGHHNMNGDTVNPTTGKIHATCEECGWVEPMCTGRLAAPTRISANQPNLSQAPKYPKGTRCKAGDHDWIERREIGYGYPVERACRDCGKREAMGLRKTKFATGGLVQPSADVFGHGPTTESRVPVGLTPPERVYSKDCAVPLEDVPCRADESIELLEPSAEQKQLGIDYADLERRMIRSMGVDRGEARKQWNFWRK